MDLRKINSLVELFFEKYKEFSNLNSLFLKWLKTEKDDFFTWSQVEIRIRVLSEYLKKNISKSFILSEVYHSDHCPVGLELTF